MDAKCSAAERGVGASAWAVGVPGSAARGMPTGADWVEAMWATLQAKHEFSMLPHPIHPIELPAAAAPPGALSARPGPRIVFFGMASDFGLAHLLALLRAGLPVVAAVTSTRQKRHRFLHDAFSLVERHAGVPRHAVRRINDPEALALLAGYRPDLIVIASFDQILRRKLLALPRLGVINCHPSILPAYRGPEPLFWQILHAEPESGLTVYLVDEGIDTGPILGQAVFPVEPDETAGSLARRATFAGVPVLLAAIDHLWRGEPPPPIAAIRPPSYHPSVESQPIDWRRPAVEIARLVRAGSPDLPPYGIAGPRHLYIGRAEPVPGDPGGEPGQVVARMPEWIDVATALGRLRVRSLLAELPGSPNEHPPLGLDVAPARFDPAPT